MEFKKIDNPNYSDFKKIWKIYKSSFPFDERRNLKQQLKLFKNKKYSFFEVYKNKLLVGVITAWNFKDFIFIEHLAVRKNLTGRGIGTKLLKEFISKYTKKKITPYDSAEDKKELSFSGIPEIRPEQRSCEQTLDDSPEWSDFCDKKNIILEVEKPKSKINKKRINFYKRLGFKLNKYNYIQPSYAKSKKALNMFLMTYSHKISKTKFLKIREKIHISVYGYKKAILK